LSPYFNGRIDMPVAFDISGPHGGRWVVDFRPGREGVVAAAAAAANVEYRMEGRWLLPVLRNEVPWEDFFLSLRFSVHRDPDIHSDHLLGLLKFADAGALAAVEAFERGRGRDDRITVTCDGVDYEIERFCPHAGSDLATMAEVLPGGRIRCLAHYYEFDLASGECQNGACEPLLTSGPRTSNRGAATRTR
jgi:UDP-MurNAc hydroxylase